GTPQVIDALSRLAHDTAAPEAARLEALAAFVLVHDPSVVAMHAPSDLLDEGQAAIRRAARLVSGGLAHAGRRAPPSAAAALDEALLARYREATDAQERGELLSALGNSAGATVLPVVTAALREDVADVRAAAARALRLVDDPAADHLLATVMTSDRDPRVRAAAIFAAGLPPIYPFFRSLLLAFAVSVDLLRRGRLWLHPPPP